MLNNWIRSTMQYLRKFPVNGMRDCHLSLILSASRGVFSNDAVTITKNSCENWNLFLRNTWDNFAILITQLLARNTKGPRSNIHVKRLFHVFYGQICTYSQNVDICLSFKETFPGNLGREFQILFHMDFLCWQLRKLDKVRCSRNEALQTGCLP